MASINRLDYELIRIKDLDVRISNDVRAPKPFDEYEEDIIYDAIEYIQGKVKDKNPIYIHYYNIVAANEYENADFDELMSMIFINCEYEDHRRGLRGDRAIENAYQHASSKCVDVMAMIEFVDSGAIDSRDLDISKKQEDRILDSYEDGLDFRDKMLDFAESRNDDDEDDRGRGRNRSNHRERDRNTRKSTSRTRGGDSDRKGSASRTRGGNREEFGRAKPETSTTERTSRQRGSKPEVKEETTSTDRGNRYTAAMSRSASEPATINKEIIPDPKISQQRRTELMKTFRQKTSGSHLDKLNVTTIVRWDEGIEYSPNENSHYAPAFDARSQMLYYAVYGDNQTLPVIFPEKSTEDYYMNIEQHLGRPTSMVTRTIGPDDETEQARAIQAIIDGNVSINELTQVIDTAPINAYSIDPSADDKEDQLRKLHDNVYALTDVEQGFTAAQYTQSTMRKIAEYNGETTKIHCASMRCAKAEIVLGHADLSYLKTLSRMDMQVIHESLNDQLKQLERNKINDVLDQSVIQTLGIRFTNNINYALKHMLGLSTQIDDFLTDDCKDIYGYLEENYPSHYDEFVKLTPNIVIDTLSHVTDKEDVQKMIEDIQCDTVPDHLPKPDVTVFLSDHILFYADFDSRIILKGLISPSDISVIKQERVPVPYRLFDSILPKKESIMRKNMMRFRDGITISVARSAFDDETFLIRRVE